MTTTTDTYQQVIPDGVASTLNSISRKLRKTTSAGKGQQGGDHRGEKELAHRSSGRELQNGSLDNLTPNDAKYQ